MKIMATLSNEEVILACREYVERHHGLTAADTAPAIGADFNGSGTMRPCVQVEISFLITPPTTPYRS